MNEYSTMHIVSRINEITSYLSTPTLLELLAEESSELAQAALKKARILRGENPTPVTIDEAENNLNEELVDVAVCSLLLGSHLDESLMASKLDRMVSRLQKSKKNENLVFPDDAIDDFEDWLDDYAKKHERTGGTFDGATFAQTLADEQPLGHDVSLKLARMIFLSQ